MKKYLASQKQPATGLLATAARTVGSVAGKIASGLGIGSDAPHAEAKPIRKRAPKKTATKPKTAAKKAVPKKAAPRKRA